MPISNFSGNTYVAFSDLNGFKEMMRNHQNAAKALDKLYNTVYKLKNKARIFPNSDACDIGLCNQLYKQFKYQ